MKSPFAELNDTDAEILLDTARAYLDTAPNRAPLRVAHRKAQNSPALWLRLGLLLHAARPTLAAQTVLLAAGAVTTAELGWRRQSLWAVLRLKLARKPSTTMPSGRKPNPAKASSPMR